MADNQGWHPCFMGEFIEGWRDTCPAGLEAALGIVWGYQGREYHALVTELTLVGITSLLCCYSTASCSHFYSRDVIIKSCVEPLEICR